MPTRKPVNDPGPIATPSRSMSERCQPASAKSSAIMGSSFSALCLGRACERASTSLPPSTSATLASEVEVSIARTRMRMDVRAR
jgi:hypothetical protein